MPTVRRLLAVVVFVALVVSGAALAGRGDPQKKINPADQARAKAMLLRASDMPAGYKSTPPTRDEDDFYCRALDESDLTLTGEIESPTFSPRRPDRVRGVLFISSGGQLYESRADANASWQRGTGAAGMKCFRDGLRREIEKDGGKFIAFKRVPFPRLAERTAAFRLLGTTDGVPVQLEFVVLMQSRAHATITLGLVPIGSPRAELERLARIAAGRMKTAMRGA